jgi:hypothetical protein
MTHDDRRRVAVAVHLDPEFAGSPEREGEVRRVDLEHLVRLEAAHADVQAALCQLQLGDPVVEIENGHAGPGVQPHHRATDLDFGARAGFDPESVSGGQRPVDRSLYPVGLACRRVTDRAGHVADPGDPRGRIRDGPSAAGQCRDASRKGQRAEKRVVHVHGDSLLR